MLLAVSPPMYISHRYMILETWLHHRTGKLLLLTSILSTHRNWQLAIHASSSRLHVKDRQRDIHTFSGPAYTAACQKLYE